MNDRVVNAANRYNTTADSCKTQQIYLDRRLRKAKQELADSLNSAYSDFINHRVRIKYKSWEGESAIEGIFEGFSTKSPLLGRPVVIKLRKINRDGSASKLSASQIDLPSYDKDFTIKILDK